MEAAKTEIEKILSVVLPYAVSIVSVLGVIYTARQTRSTQLTAAYFNKMTSAYEGLWTCFVGYIFNPSHETYIGFTTAIYTAMLYATDDTMSTVTKLYHKALEYVDSDDDNTDTLNSIASDLEWALHDDLQKFTKRRRRSGGSNPETKL